jgi:hypothetical protein
MVREVAKGLGLFSSGDLLIRVLRLQAAILLNAC